MELVNQQVLTEILNQTNRQLSRNQIVGDVAMQVNRAVAMQVAMQVVEYGLNFMASNEIS